MFYMVNKYGNAHKKVESERKRDELIALGCHEVKEPTEADVLAEEPAEAAVDEEKPKKGKAKKNDTKE